MAQPAIRPSDEPEIEFELERVDLDSLTDEDRRIMAEMDAGRSISHEAMKRWLLTWGTDNPLPPPKCGE